MKAAITTFAGGLALAAILSVVFSYTYRPVLDTPLGKDELLIYCTNSTIKPMAEIARVIEQRENCRIILSKGGSGNLLRAIKVNQLGDLYLPGSDSFIRMALEEGLVTEKTLVGYNTAALMVQKGNPKHIAGDLADLADPRYYVVIGNPLSDSIGQATKEILQERGIADQVARNTKQWATDSKDLVRVLKDKEADLVVNWRAAGTWPENAPYVDILPIDPKYGPRHRLVLGLLKYSRHPEIARKLMDYAASEEGRALFKRYGLFESD